LSGQTYLGYAHGAAGIADALLDLFEVTADARLFEAACGTARWLQSLAVPALDDASGLCWPTAEGAEPVAAYWCHGAAGIGRFWIHAAALGVMPGAADVAARAIATTARGARWAGPTQCHGLAGAIEVLIDAYQANNDPAFLAKARILERLLLAFACEVDGQLAWPSESPTVITPDYNVGYAGVASALLRLADPARRPHGLSRQGFRFDSKGCRG
jgi:lantibiotic modifying enzyme